MAAQNPQIKKLTTNAWNLVAEDVTTGILHILDTDVIYYQTYRVTSGSAPSGSILPDSEDFEGVMIYNKKYNFHNTSTAFGGASINSTSGIDVYIYVQDPYIPYDEDRGRIRIDIG
jgi:hypothetical protein